MQDSFIKMIVISLWGVTSIGLLSGISNIIGSVFVSLYFGAMLKRNIINKYYKGSWGMFLKSIIKRKKK